MSQTPGILLQWDEGGRLSPRLEALAPVTRLWELDDPVAFARSASGQAIAVAVVIGAIPLAPSVLDALAGLKAIVCLGAGYDGVDLAKTAARGIAVSNTPGVNTEDVADHTLALMLASRRRILEGDALVRTGAWTAKNRGPRHRSLGGSVVGVIGLGAIGRAVARRVEAFGCTVQWWGPRPKPEAPWPRAESVAALAAASDILIVSTAATAETRHIVDVSVLEALGAEGLLVNVSRGSTVDEAALKRALREGRLGAAALDVFAQEPTPAADWADVPNVVLAPHAGSFTPGAGGAVLDLAVANVKSFLETGALVSPVPQAPPTGR